MPPEAQPHLARAIGIGRLLHAYDQVAAEGTDVMQANADATDRATVGGYLVVHSDTRWSVLFFTKGDDPRICARITVEPGKPSVFQRVRPTEPASAAERNAIRARQAALTAVPEVLQPLNPVVLTNADGVEVQQLATDLGSGALAEGKSVIYLLAGTSRPGVAVLGRHYRALARPDGTIEKIEAMSKAPIEISEADLPPGARTVAMVVSHVLGDWPTEAHVFASLLYRQPVHVITRRGHFRVAGDRIERLPLPVGAPTP
jgi:hypothetical protein